VAAGRSVKVRSPDFRQKKFGFRPTNTTIIITGSKPILWPEASQLLGLREDEKRAALGEFSNQRLERRASRAAACENLPSGKLLVGESPPVHIIMARSKPTAWLAISEIV